MGGASGIGAPPPVSRLYRSTLEKILKHQLADCSREQSVKITVK